MNQNTIQKMKEFYEKNLARKLAKGLNIDIKRISPQWSVDKISCAIDLSKEEFIFSYLLTYENGNLTLQSQAYKILTDAAKHIIGIESKPTSIDLHTLTVLSQIFESVSNEEYTEPDCCENSEEVCRNNSDVVGIVEESGEVIDNVDDSSDAAKE